MLHFPDSSTNFGPRQRGRGVTDVGVVSTPSTKYVLLPVTGQGAATPIYTVLAAATGIKMTSFRRCTDVYGKLVACTSMHGNILF